MLSVTIEHDARAARMSALPWRARPLRPVRRPYAVTASSSCHLGCEWIAPERASAAGFGRLGQRPHVGMRTCIVRMVRLDSELAAAPCSIATSSPCAIDPAPASVVALLQRSPARPTLRPAGSVGRGSASGRHGERASAPAWRASWSAGRRTSTARTVLRIALESDRRVPASNTMTSALLPGRSCSSDSFTA